MIGYGRKQLVRVSVKMDWSAQVLADGRQPTCGERRMRLARRRNPPSPPENPCRYRFGLRVRATFAPGIPAMPQFEYRAIDLGDLPPRTDEVMLLNAAGADGWELVAITSNNIGYLRRQIEDPAYMADKPLAASSMPAEGRT
jgi:hypothetical protein